MIHHAITSASFLILSVLTTTILSPAESKTPAVELVAIKAGHLLDVAAGNTLERQVILVEGDTIKLVGAEGRSGLAPDDKAALFIRVDPERRNRIHRR